MLVRLLLVLLLSLGALPGSAAACHAPTVGHGMTMEHHAPDKAAPSHGCIGCVPPGDLLGARLPAAPLATRQTPVARIATLDLTDSAPPAVPPPRRG